MKKRVILYILSVIGIVILNCLYVNFEFMVMLVMVIVIPLFSYIIFSISKHGMKIFVKINNSVVSVGDNIDVRIIEGGNSLFGPPEGVLKAQIRYSNDGDTKQAEVEIGSGSMRECSLDFKPKHIGIVNIYFISVFFQLHMIITVSERQLFFRRKRMEVSGLLIIRMKRMSLYYHLRKQIIQKCLI